MRQGEHDGLGTYRKDGNDNAHGTEHSIIYCLASFQRILDVFIIAVKPSVVRLDGAGLDDQEGQARWSRWNHCKYHGWGEKREEENISARRLKNDLKLRPP